MLNNDLSKWQESLPYNAEKEITKNLEILISSKYQISNYLRYAKYYSCEMQRKRDMLTPQQRHLMIENVVTSNKFL